MEMLNIVFVIQVVIVALLSIIYVTMRIQEEREVAQLEEIKRDIQMIEWRIRGLEAASTHWLTSEKISDEINKGIDDYINEDIKATHEFYVQNEEEIAARYFETARRNKNVE